MKYILHIVLFFCLLSQVNAQEDGVVALNIPVRNSLKFNRQFINPTFSFVREQNKYISFNNKREWVQFDNAPQTYLFGYSGRFRENIGAGLSLFQQDYGVLTTFGGNLNFAYNVVLDRYNNLTFGLNLGFYKSSINEGNVITNFPDPSLSNIPSNSIITINPGINYGTDFFDFGVSLNNLASYNLTSSEMIEENPEQSIQAHAMYTGYVNSRGFFDESKFSGLIRSEFKKDQTIISGIMMLTIPKGFWGQVGYSSFYGVSAGIGLNISSQIALEYNYEKAVGDLSALGNAHDITIAYKFKNRNRYDYSGDDEEEALIIPKKKSYRPVARRKPSTRKVNKPKAATASVLTEQKKQDQIAEEAKAKLELEKQAELEAAAKLKAEQEAQALAEAEAKRLADIEKAKAEQEAKRLEAAARLKAEQEAQALAEAEAKRLADIEKAKAEQEAKRLEAAARLKAEQEAQALAEAEAKRLADIEKAKAEQEAKRLEAAARLKAEQEAQALAEAEAKRLADIEKAKAEQEAALKDGIVPTDEVTQLMNDITQETVASNKEQEELLSRLTEKVAIKQQDLDDLIEENNLSEQGIVKAPKPFKSVTAENRELETLSLEIEGVIQSQNEKIRRLERIYNERLKDVSDKNDPANVYYKEKIQELKAQQMQAIQLRQRSFTKIEQLKEDIKEERKRRIKRALYDNEDDRYEKDRATLNRIKQNTAVSSTPLTAEDFDYGEELNNIQIVKDVKHVESGYYLVIAVHSDVEKRDEFLRKAVASGQSDVNFFYDVNTSKYYIYYEKFNGLNQAQGAMQNKGNKPYNGKMSMVKIEN
ncbi:PorP/SprF family type IX secretion system membrane protein [Tamlana sp. 2201CG12-4]|uniref:PorP/SprF family type IX secretion system membrane protein n=1 Tax=Tamlana sp. 2201CG12-4 TaxID=3112582 RepID=UPI002DBE8F52|nr:PorP/SprF family type IX secretion system membrane protein [Tamlana sp. 2201CG12-4]MEC3908717.1 PorP/SprF family type IX secretion system membrane protein [Tamlana sp. 2201CG12-4]